MKFFYLLLIVSLLQSCVVYYNTNDMRNSMNNNIAQIESNYSLTKSDYLEKKKLYQGLESNVLDKNENSFTKAEYNGIMMVYQENSIFSDKDIEKVINYINDNDVRNIANMILDFENICFAISGKNIDKNKIMKVVNKYH